MVTRPMIIPPEVKSPDYTGFLRRASSNAPMGNSSFADVMTAEQNVSGQNSVRQSPTALPPTLEERKAMQEGKPLSSGGRSSELLSRNPMALDSRSLNTLKRLSESAQRPAPAANESTARSGAKPEAPARPGSKASTETVGAGNAAAPADAVQSGKAADAAAAALAATPAAQAQGLGKLSAQYESGSLGISAIGYDRNGGTSYGKYQISSRQGSFARFLDYAAKEAPDIAERLRTAGNANTGSKRGAVPEAWKAIAAEQPELFEKLQEGFIRHSHYDPAEGQVKRVLGTENLSRPMQEVLWSTAVQHGPTGAQRLFERAAQKLSKQGKSLTDEKSLIEALYNLRGTQFSSSTPSVQAAVRQRFDTEKRQALAMLQEQVTLA